MLGILQFAVSGTICADAHRELEHVVVSQPGARSPLATLQLVPVLTNSGHPGGFGEQHPARCSCWQQPGEYRAPGMAPAAVLLLPPAPGPWPRAPARGAALHGSRPCYL